MIRSLVRNLLKNLQPPPTPTTVEERLAELAREVQSLRLEWAETLDKVERWMHRTRARSRVEDDAPAPGNGSPSAAAQLVPGPDPVSARLLERRRGRSRLGGAAVPPDAKLDGEGNGG